MNAKKLFPITLLVIASLACSLFEGVIPDVRAATSALTGEIELQAEAEPDEDQTPEAETVERTVSTGSESGEHPAGDLTYPIVDTGQSYCYDDGVSMPCPIEGESFYGQDAQYNGNAPSYTDNGDGTITDNVTGLIWQKDPGEKMTYQQAVAGAESFDLAGYDDWRLPTIKELYSLIQFSGTDASRCAEEESCTTIPFIDSDYFEFAYGDTAAGERMIDSQWATSTIYTGRIMNGGQAMFGVNFADGRVKGYGTGADRGGREKRFFVIYVRGNSNYGVNDFVDNDDGTVTDNATGLTWMQADSGASSDSAQGGLDWEGALNYCASLDYAGISDWRLPNAKELHSIVDYTRSPDATNSAAIDPIFDISSITNEAGQLDYPAFWTSTTHVSSNGFSGSGVYINFGRSMGYMNGAWMDVHGAGAQRVDQKRGDPSNYPTGRGPQGDAVRIYNYARCVSGGPSGDVLISGETEPLIKEANEEPVAEPQAVEKVHAEEDAQPSAESLYLFSPLKSTETYLMGADGRAVYTWQSDYTPGNAVYLLENGNLLRTGSLRSGTFDAGGSGGIVQEIAPDSSIVWEYEYADELVQLHHDIEPMPNGNILMIAWERKSEREAIAAGRDSSLLRDGELWVDHIIEVDPATNRIVWAWHVWDHLVQDYDAGKPNYGSVAEHPERIDLNYTDHQAAADWTHINSIDYNAELDQILLSVRGFDEIWIIDHDTTTEEAAGSAGDLLYRWGNPQTHDAGTEAEQQFFGQHDAQWIPDGFSGDGNILVFNNGDRRVRSFSSVDEIVPPLNGDGEYALTPGVAYGPTNPAWSYAGPDFFADHISGVQRLSNGNTLICNGTEGIFFEVTSDGEIVWQYDYGGEVFRVSQIVSDHPGLASLNLQAGEMLTAEFSGSTAQPSGTGQAFNHGEPPARALEACSGLEQGAACSVTTPKGGEHNGVCKSVQNQLVHLCKN
jgi:hypothetical protein